LRMPRQSGPPADELQLLPASNGPKIQRAGDRHGDKRSLVGTAHTILPGPDTHRQSGTRPVYWREARDRRQPPHWWSRPLFRQGPNRPDRRALRKQESRIGLGDSARHDRAKPAAASRSAASWPQSSGSTPRERRPASWAWPRQPNATHGAAQQRSPYSRDKAP